MDYVPTHVSVFDGSDAMVVTSKCGVDTIALINEDGFEWSDPIEYWERIV